MTRPYICAHVDEPATPCMARDGQPSLDRTGMCETCQADPAEVLARIVRALLSPNDASGP